MYKSENISNVAREAGGKASLTWSKVDIEEHVEKHKEALTNDVLKDMLKSSTEDNNVKDLEEVDLSFWTLEKFAAGFNRHKC